MSPGRNRKASAHRHSPKMAAKTDRFCQGGDLCEDFDLDGEDDAAAAAARCFAWGFLYPIGALPLTGAPAPGGVREERAQTELPIVLPSVMAVASERHDELAGGPRECGEGKGEVIISINSGYLDGDVRIYGKVWCQRRGYSSDMGGVRRTRDSGCYILGTRGDVYSSIFNVVSLICITWIIFFESQLISHFHIFSAIFC